LDGNPLPPLTGCPLAHQAGEGTASGCDWGDMLCRKGKASSLRGACRRNNPSFSSLRGAKPRGNPVKKGTKERDACPFFIARNFDNHPFKCK
jgi:hypothetical protein